MMKLVALGLAVFLIFYFFNWARRKNLYGDTKEVETKKIKLPEILKESWIQLYETASKAEAQQLKAHLEELEVQSILYEQGKKSVDGKELPGIGFVVPKSQLRRAQNLLFRFLERNK